MKKIELTAEEFQEFLYQKIDETRTILRDGEVREEDLSGFGFDFLKLEETSPNPQYVFWLQDGFVKLYAGFNSTKLLIRSMRKIDDDFLKYLVEEKERLTKQLNEIHSVLDHFRLKTLFL